MEEEYDVIVVGAGFGGPVAAKKCADAGLKTLMLERSEVAGENVLSGCTIPIYGFICGPAFIRDGNPPIERPTACISNYIVKNIDADDIDIDDSLRFPKPLSPIFTVGYNTYCKPFCEWEAKKAVEAGVELKTSASIVDMIKENGCIKGVVTDKGEKIRAKIVIDAEGSQGLLAIKAGVREKYPPEVISLADTYDYEVPKEDMDRLFDFTNRFYWGWDEQKIAPPLGHGNGLMLFPYRESIHAMQDQCLRTDHEEVPNLKKLLEEYHENMTTRLRWWKEEVAPYVKLRARLWDGMTIFVGLNERLRNMPNYTDGMILIGDVAGLEGTALCDGIPCTWFSAEIGADVAIEAIRANDTSRSFLKRYSDRIKEHGIIQWSITNPHRYNLRYAQKNHDEKMLKEEVHKFFGLGIGTEAGTGLLKTILPLIKDDPAIIGKWIKMFFRYYCNWQHERYDYGMGGEHARESPKVGGVVSRTISWIRDSLLQIFGSLVIRTSLWTMDSLLQIFSSLIRSVARLLEPVSTFANPLLKIFLPIYEGLLEIIEPITDPLTDPLSKVMVSLIERVDPSIFEVST